MIGSSTAAPSSQPLRNALRTLALNVRSVVVMPFGLLHYIRTRRTPEIAYQSLVWLFCSTSGRFNDLLSWMLSRRRPKVVLDRTTGVLGDVGNGEARRLADRLRADGYVLFPAALDKAACDRLAAFAQKTPAKVRRMDHEASSSPVREAVFDASAPLGVRYDYPQAALLDNEDVQALLADPTLLAVAQEYLNCMPVADVLSMWWHTNYHTQPDSEAAQFFHFDLDRIKWLKIFVYLTDVGPDNGPHSFVRGSHRSGGIPPEILRRGYVRLLDDEVHALYPPRDILEFSAPRGTVIIEDTRGLHKGANVRADARLILQMQFSNSLFGTNYPHARIETVKHPSLQQMLARAPAIYRQYR